MHPLCRIGIHSWEIRVVHGPFRKIIKLRCKRCPAENNIVRSRHGKWAPLWKVKAMHAAKQQDWQTPPELFKVIEQELGFKFTLDPCAPPENNLSTPKFYTEEDDGLKQSWRGEKAYMNPPYGNLPAWVEKAYWESQHEDTIIVGLLPVRTSPKYMRHYVWTRRAKFLGDLSDARKLMLGEIGIFFLPKRVRFIDPNTGQKTGSPYFDSMLVVWR